jgi:hypothetical protein
MAADVASVQFSRTVESHHYVVQRISVLGWSRHLRHGLTGTGGLGRSLKTQQHAGIVL